MLCFQNLWASRIDIELFTTLYDSYIMVMSISKTINICVPWSKVGLDQPSPTGGWSSIPCPYGFLYGGLVK